MTTYSPLSPNVDEIWPGDQVDISTALHEPAWRTVLAVGDCGTDPADDSDHSDGRVHVTWTDGTDCRYPAAQELHVLPAPEVTR